MAKQIPLPKMYPIPTNWEWVEIEKLVFMRSGFPFDSSKFSTEQEGRRPLIRIRDVVKGETATFTDEECPDEYIIHNGDVLIGMDGDFNIAKWKSNDALLNQRVCYIRTKSDALLNDYLFYYLPDPLKKINDSTPSVTVKHLSTKTLGKTSIPIPPLPEQRRIVARIESLFAKLDEAKEKAQAVVDGFEERKAAILHKAFTGELTREWRDNTSEKTFRTIVTIKSICHSLKYGTASKSVPSGRVAVIRMGNLQGGEIEWRNLVYSNNEDDNNKYKLIPGDVLFNRTNSAEHVGKTAIYRGEIPAIYAGYLIKIDYDRSVIIGEYLNIILNSPEAKLYCNRVKTDAVNQSNINAQKIGAFEFPLISIEEQHNIIETVNRFTEKSIIAKESAESVITQIDTMKKSILARAFRGELGTNDPADEPAVEMLKRMMN